MDISAVTLLFPRIVGSWDLGLGKSPKREPSSGSRPCCPGQKPAGSFALPTCQVGRAAWSSSPWKARQSPPPSLALQLCSSLSPRDLRVVESPRACPPSSFCTPCGNTSSYQWS